MPLECAVFEAKVIKLGLDLIIVIFGGVRCGCDNEAATEGKVLVILPSEGS